MTEKGGHGDKENSKNQQKLRILLRTFGCQMNERDSEIIHSMMMEDGYAPADSYQDADLIIFNTCSVRRHAEDRVWGKIGELAALKRKRKDIVLGLVGCMGKVYGKEIFKRLPHVDFVCGPANIYDIPAVVEKVKSGKRHIVNIDNKIRPVKKGNAGFRTEKIKAFVSISEGCNNFCSYCVVPYARGTEVSRPSQDIIDEIKILVDAGTKEVMLLGQNVNSYKYEGMGFVRLLEMVDNIKGLRRIRFMTSHPKDADKGLFKAMAGLKKVCQHLHLPLQSGSNRILELMNRKYTVSHYKRLIDNFRKAVSTSAVTTDIIVGFPTETEKDFKDTYMFMKEIRFDSAFIFKYSPRPFTEASKMQDDVPQQLKQERNRILLELQDKITKEKEEMMLGETQEVLGLSGVKRRPDSSPPDDEAYYIKGRNRLNYQVVYKADKGLIGEIVNVKIKDTYEHTLIGELA